jgi:multiple sugar transport system permease protein
LGLAAFRGVMRTQWNLLMAASTAMTLPVIILFFFLQRYFIRGVVMSGLKG